MIQVLIALVVATLLSLALAKSQYDGKIEAEATYKAFVAQQEALGEKAKAEVEAENRRVQSVLRAGKERFDAQTLSLEKLRADNGLLTLSLQHYIRAGPGVLSTVPKTPGTSESRESAGVSDREAQLTKAVEHLTADGYVTAQLFAACRDEWRSIAK